MLLNVQVDWTCFNTRNEPKHDLPCSCLQSGAVGFDTESGEKLSSTQATPAWVLLSVSLFPVLNPAAPLCSSFLFLVMNPVSKDFVRYIVGYECYEL